MKIVDNFFTPDELLSFRELLQPQLTKKNQLPYKTLGRIYNQLDEITGTENSYLFLIKNQARSMFLEKLISLGLVYGEIRNSLVLSDLVYLDARASYQGKWHRDRTNHESQIPDLVAFILFLNPTWEDQDGGLFFYRHDAPDSDVVFVSPIENRLIYNHDDLCHGVSTIVNSAVTRSSCQIFVPQNLLCQNDLHRI